MIDQQTAEHYIWGSVCDGWHLVRNPALSVISERMPPGASEVRHYHERSHQFFYVLSGTLTMEIDGRKETLGARQGVEVPPGMPHQARNTSAHDVEFLVISQPPSHGDLIAVPLGHND